MKESFYRRLIDEAPFAHSYHQLIVDEHENPVDYRFIEVNDAFEAITGIKKESVIGKTILELIPTILQDDFDWITHYAQIAMHGGTAEFEEYSKPLKKWFRIQVFSWERCYFSTIFSDITQSKNSSEQLDRFFSINLDLLCIANIDGKFEKINPEWERTLGYSPEDLGLLSWQWNAPNQY